MKGLTTKLLLILFAVSASHVFAGAAFTDHTGPKNKIVNVSDFFAAVVEAVMPTMARTNVRIDSSTATKIWGPTAAGTNGVELGKLSSEWNSIAPRLSPGEKDSIVLSTLEAIDNGIAISLKKQRENPSLAQAAQGRFPEILQRLVAVGSAMNFYVSLSENEELKEKLDAYRKSNGGFMSFSKTAERDSGIEVSKLPRFLPFVGNVLSVPMTQAVIRGFLAEKKRQMGR